MIPKYPKNHGKWWTQADIALLVKLSEEGWTKKELADYFHRTEYSIYCKAVSLNIDIFDIQEKDLIINDVNYSHEMSATISLLHKRVDQHARIVQNKLNEERILRKRNR